MLSPVFMAVRRCSVVVSRWYLHHTATVQILTLPFLKCFYQCIGTLCLSCILIISFLIKFNTYFVLHNAQ
jgi:hypothetical protein